LGDNNLFQVKAGQAEILPTQFSVLPSKASANGFSLLGGQEGIGDGMIPSNNRALYGIERFTSVSNVNLKWQYFPDKQQNMSGRINGTFMVYHELGHGDDSYLVVYQEDGLVSLGDLISDQALARGYFMYRMDTSVTPNIGGTNANWVASSPSTLNQSQEVQNQTVDTFSQTINIGIAEETGPSSGASSSESTQLWHGFTMKISDWNITEKSDANTNQCSWMWYQNVPWTGNDKPLDDFTWWEQAYNVGGGWDDTKPLPELSRTTMQYHSSAAWRFPTHLIDPNTKKLMVNFSGSAKYYLAAINMPQCGDNGQHQIWHSTPENTWQHQFDLVSIAELK